MMLPGFTVTGISPETKAKNYSTSFDGTYGLTPRDVYGMMPVVGDALDIKDIGTDLYNGDYINAGIGAGLFLLPNVVERPLKAVGRFLLNKGKKAYNTTKDLLWLTKTYNNVGTGLKNPYVRNKYLDLAKSPSTSRSFIEKYTPNKNEAGLDVLKRIERLELQISDLTCSQVYQDIHKLHIALVTSPIKKTNVILKNVNFQYAVKLWNYMQENMDDGIKKSHDSKDYNDTGTLKKYMDESFLLNYLVLDTLSNEEKTTDKKEITEKIVSNMVSKIMDLSGGNLKEEELKDIVSKQYSVVKYKTVVNDKEIYKIFKKNMDEYLNLIRSIKL